jgi:hypothetical protein
MHTADIPVEQLIKFELALNMRTAKPLGRTTPPSLQALANLTIDIGSCVLQCTSPVTARTKQK